MKPTRLIVTALAVGMLLLGYFAWTRNQDRPAPAAGSRGQGGGEAAGGGPEMPPGEVAPPPAMDPGVTWEKPKRWLAELASSMRIATYVVPAAAGDAEDARCAVYYFGPAGGGSVEDNLQRWAGEFQGGAEPARSTKDVHGIPVTRARLAGTYLAHGAMSGEMSGPKPDWMLLGAIAEGPRGRVFFKCAGPKKTMAAAVREFDGMIASLGKK